MYILRIFLLLIISINLADASEFGKRMMMSEEECQEVAYCPESTIPASIVGLLGCPDCWKDKSIKVYGWISYDLHGSTLHMSSEHCEEHLTEYGIGVRLKLIKDSESFLASKEPCQLAEVQGIYRPTDNREPKPGVLKYRDLWPGIVDAEYLRLRNN